MSKYINETCILCNEKFKEDDDIVVCPECGTPYHRACYLTEGKCINTELHESGEAWHKSAETVSEPKNTRCYRCGTENAPNEKFCKNCGTPAQDEDQGYQSRSFNEYIEDYGRFGTNPFLKVQRVSPETEVEGVKIGEYIKYVGSNFFYFIPKFLQFSKGRKVSFNFSAFIFPELYFFYRKMFKEGIVAVIVSLLFSLPTMAMYLDNYRILTLPFLNQPWFETASEICFFLGYAFKILVALYANYLYYRKARADITKIKSEVLEVSARNEKIELSGGTSFKYVIAAYLGIMALMFIASWLTVAFLA